MASSTPYILLDFWYASCYACLQAMPFVNQLYNHYADQGLEVIGINCFDKGISSNLTSRMRERNITMPLLFGSRDLVESLEMSDFPSYILVTPDRKVEYIQGYVDELKKVLESIFDK
jgi:hypothetical protein